MMKKEKSAAQRVKEELKRAASLTLECDTVTIAFGRTQQADRLMAALTSLMVEGQKDVEALLGTRKFAKHELVPLSKVEIPS